MDNTEDIVSIDYRNFRFKDFGYVESSAHDAPRFEIDKGLGEVTYRMKVLRFQNRVDLQDFPWPDEDRGIFQLANPIHLAVFAQRFGKFPFYLFAIGEPRQHSRGLMIAEVKIGDNFAGDAYLPSWVTDPEASLKVKPPFGTEGFPPGVGFLVVAKA